MNAKKLKKCFQGTKASGFGKYRERTLFSLTEEFRITNPHLKGGVIIADWENEVAKTGKVVIIPNEDGSIVLTECVWNWLRTFCLPVLPDIGDNV